MSSNRIPANSPDASTNVPQDFDAAFGAVIYNVAGAIGQKEGVVVINGSAALAMTLVAPTAGLPAAGGDDGKELVIISGSAFIHTVTTPANAINGSKHIITFSVGAVGNFQTLYAFGGLWYAAQQAGSALT